MDRQNGVNPLMSPNSIYEWTLREGRIVARFKSSLPQTVNEGFYLFARPKFPNGARQTLSRFARAVPVIAVDGEWKCNRSRSALIVDWARDLQDVEAVPDGVNLG